MIHGKPRLSCGFLGYKATRGHIPWRSSHLCVDHEGQVDAIGLNVICLNDDEWSIRDANMARTGSVHIFERSLDLFHWWSTIWSTSIYKGKSVVSNILLKIHDLSFKWITWWKVRIWNYKYDQHCKLPWDVHGNQRFPSQLRIHFLCKPEMWCDGIRHLAVAT